MAMNKRKRIDEIAGVEKAPTGIVGFDSIIGGGLPRGRTTLVLGGTGAGKTVFSLQVLVGGMRQHGEPGMCVSMEEDVQQMIVNTAGFGWDLPGLIRERKFFVIDARMGPGIVKAGAFDLTGLLAEIKAHADKIGARRIVFDSLDSLLTLLDDPKAERQELYRLRDWLAENNLTGIINVHSEAGLVPFPRYGFLQSMVDCVVVLDNRMVGDHFSRILRIVKCRGRRFLGNEFPMLIDSGGIQIAVGPQKSDYAVSSKRVSTGIGRLDDMLRGGYYRGSSVLITGAPGSAKSTLVGAFLEAACRRGERALYVGFDEAVGAILRNLA